MLAILLLRSFAQLFPLLLQLQAEAWAILLLELLAVFRSAEGFLLASLSAPSLELEASLRLQEQQLLTQPLAMWLDFEEALLPSSLRSELPQSYQQEPHSLSRPLAQLLSQASQFQATRRIQ